jgi:hypothetical protein
LLPFAAKCKDAAKARKFDEPSETTARSTRNQSTRTCISDHRRLHHDQRPTCRKLGHHVRLR